MRPNRLALFSRILTFLLLTAPAAVAAEISFDELPPVNGNTSPLAEEYADMGVHFVTTDDGSVWSGVSDGDPGGWGLEGTNGSAFVGFNGSSYGLSATFDEPVEGLQLDVARSLFSKDGDTFVLEGYLDGAMVEQVVVPLPAVGVWTTVSLTEMVDEMVWRGEGVSSLHPFGVDNLRWLSEPEEPPAPTMIEARVDVRRGYINPFFRGRIPVVLFGADDLDVRDVDPSTLALGPGEARPWNRHTRFYDVDRDGLEDMVLKFGVRRTGLGWGDEEVCLSGATMGATPFEGCDHVQTTPWWFKHLHRRH